MVIHGIAFFGAGWWGMGNRTGEWRAGVWPARKGAFLLLPDRIFGLAGALNPRIPFHNRPGSAGHNPKEVPLPFLNTPSHTTG